MPIKSCVFSVCIFSETVNEIAIFKILVLKAKLPTNKKAKLHIQQFQVLTRVSNVQVLYEIEIIKCLKIFNFLFQECETGVIKITLF